MQENETSLATELVDARPTIAGAKIRPFQQVDRRRLPRHIITKPVMAIPVLPAGEPDLAGLTEGFLVDLSAGGIGLELGCKSRLSSTNLVVGVEADDGRNYFATVEVMRMATLDRGLRLGGQFAGGGADLFRPQNVHPHLDGATACFAMGLSEQALSKWAEVGVVSAVELDRYHVCPDCGRLPTFRRGCRACGSSRVRGCQLIHHFGCAHVGYVAEFEQVAGLVCPKCRTRHLVIGADFEYVPGPYRCADCGWSDTDLEEVGKCLGCNLRFPIRDACEKILTGYHVDRLDPLAFIGST